MGTVCTENVVIKFPILGNGYVEDVSPTTVFRITPFTLVKCVWLYKTLKDNKKRYKIK